MLELDEVDQHPHNASRNSFIRKDNLMHPVPAPKLSVTPGASCTNKPKLLCGQQTSEILKSIGYSQTEIDKFMANKVIYEESKSRI